MLPIAEINIHAQSLIYDYGTNPAVADIDLARQRLDALNKRNGPRVGDFVWFPNEERPRRFTYDLSDGSMQTTINESNDSSFPITRSGYCDFSGSLDSAIWLDQCHDTGKNCLAAFGFSLLQWRDSACNKQTHLLPSKISLRESNLEHAARNVLVNWEGGDLAGAISQLSNALQ